MSSHVIGATMKVAVALLAAFIVTLQLALLPEQAPDHALNLKPAPGLAVRPTTVPALYLPPTELGRAPIEPVPTVDNNRVNCCGGGGGSAAKVGNNNDKRIVNAQKEFDNGKNGLCLGHYWRADHEFWETYVIAHEILKTNRR